MKLFVVAPVSDQLTKETSALWALETARFARDLNIDVCVCIGSCVNRDMVEAALRQDQDEPGLFCFFDHGEPDKLLDSHGKPLIDSQNVGLLRNKFVFALACEAGATLGALAVARGAAGFLGFSDLLYWPRAEAFPRLVGRCLLQGITTMLADGGCAADAKDAMRRRHLAAVEDILGQQDLLASIGDWVIAALSHNSDALVLHGDGNWRWVA